MTAILLAFAASCAWGFADWAGGLCSRTLRVPVVLFLSMTSGFALLAPVLVVRGGPQLTARETGLAVLAGAIAVGSLGLMFRAMAVGSMSVIGPITACGVIVPVVVGLATGEQPSALQLAGIVAAVIGIVLASIERDDEAGDGRRLIAGLWLALGSAVCIGLWFVVFDAAATSDPYWASGISRMTTALCVGAVVLVRRVPFDLGAAGRTVLLLAVASGLTDAAAEVLYAVATTKGYLSLVSVIASLYPAFIVALGAVVLRERLAPHQVAGVASALAGIALISAG